MKKILSKLAMRLIMVALALTMVFTFAACGGGDDDDQNTNKDGIPNNTHSKNVIEGKWYRGEYCYYFNGNGKGNFYWPSNITDMTCNFTYNVQGNGNWGTVFINAVYVNHTSHTTWRDEKSGSYNLQDGKLYIEDFTYYKK